jgi:DNA polymerase (family 10)
MNNQRLADLFYEMADLLDILSVEWKPIAYRKAARNIESLQEDVAVIYKKGGIRALEDIPGVGKAIAEKTVEFLETGRIKEIEQARKKLPGGIADLLSIRGIGPKTIKELYKKLHITSVAALEKAAKAGRISRLAGFGRKSEQDMLESIGFMRKGTGRALLGKALPLSREIEETLRKVNGVSQVITCGSVRRRKETCADIDILATSTKPKAVMDAFTSMPDVVKVTGKGGTKSSVLLAEGLASDLRVVEPKSFGAAVQYFTGNKDHNVRTRQVALKKGLTLNEYGLWTLKGHKYVCGKTEEEIYRRLGLPFVPPEMRENTGELELRKIPELIGYNDLKGDLHMHTVWSDGVNQPQQMVAMAEKLGYDYMAITDHSKSERQANGMDSKRFLRYISELRRLADRPSLTARSFSSAAAFLLSSACFCERAASRSFCAVWSPAAGAVLGFGYLRAEATRQNAALEIAGSVARSVGTAP